ncbi:reverse transcriptase domain-containing protein, partial [Tanacetum coccineum]
DGDDVRDHVEIGLRDVRDDTEEYEADASAGDTVKVGIDPMSAPIVKEEIVEPAGEDSSYSSGTRDSIVRSFKDMSIDLNDDVRDFYHHMSEVRIDRIIRIETVQRLLEVDQLIAKGQRVSMVERTDSLRRSFVRTDAAYALSWRELLKLMTEVYFPRNEFQKMETELWNLSVKNNDMATYTQRFQELTMMCTKMVPDEEDQVKKFIGGLPDNIQGNVIAAEPTRLQDAVRITNHLMDKKLKGYAVRNTKNKRRLDNNY